jgi:hypothetical protein
MRTELEAEGVGGEEREELRGLTRETAEEVMDTGIQEERIRSVSQDHKGSKGKDKRMVPFHDKRMNSVRVREKPRGSGGAGQCSVESEGSPGEGE